MFGNVDCPPLGPTSPTQELGRKPYYRLKEADVSNSDELGIRRKA
jgi:hypothetical protein